jgi:UDP-glucose 4-epimerase
MGQPITVWRTAYDQKRPYLDLADASRALSFLIRNDLFDGRIYNVLTQNATVREIVDMISEFVPGLRVTFVDSQIMNQLSYMVSSDRLVGQGFTFTGDLRKGIGETIARLRQANAAHCQ